jgi:hypothetical protein
MVQLSATRCSCIAILRVSLVSFAAITLRVASQRVFIIIVVVVVVVVVYFVIDSVRKLLDTPSYTNTAAGLGLSSSDNAHRQVSWKSAYYCLQVWYPQFNQEADTCNLLVGFRRRSLRRCIQKFPDWVVTKWTTERINTRREATQRVMTAKLTRLTHKIAIQLRLVAESCTVCSSRSRRPVRKLLDTPSYCFITWKGKSLG